MTPEEIILIEGGPGEHDSHLTYAELEAWVDGRVSGIERELAVGHFELCGVCRAEASDLAAVRDSLRGRRRQTIPGHSVFLY